MGSFFRKPCSPAEQYGAPCDGCALFYLSKRFDSYVQPQGKSSAAVFLCQKFHYTSASTAETPCSSTGMLAAADTCSFVTGQTFRTTNGVAGNQGMLMVQLCDRESGALICAATTHLKAKSGATNDAIRDHQVGFCHSISVKSSMPVKPLPRNCCKSVGMLSCAGSRSAE